MNSLKNWNFPSIKKANYIEKLVKNHFRNNDKNTVKCLFKDIGNKLKGDCMISRIYWAICSEVN